MSSVSRYLLFNITIHFTLCDIASKACFSLADTFTCNMCVDALRTHVASFLAATRAQHATSCHQRTTVSTPLFFYLIRHAADRTVSFSFNDYRLYQQQRSTPKPFKTPSSQARSLHINSDQSSFH